MRQFDYVSSSIIFTSFSSCLPHNNAGIEPYHLALFKRPSRQRKDSRRSSSGAVIDSLPELMSLVDGRPEVLRQMIGDELTADEVDKVYRHISQLPMLETRLKITGELDLKAWREMPT